MDIPHPVNLNSLQKLTRLRPQLRDQKFCTFAFVLNKDILKSDGSLDDLYAIIFPLESHETKEEGSEYARRVIQQTGHSGIVCASFAEPVRLSTDYDPRVVEEVKVDAKGKLVEMESAQYKREKEEYEMKIKREKEYQEEQEAETDPSSLEYYKRQCYVAVKNKAAYEHHKNEMDKYEEAYEKRIRLAKKHYLLYPEHESQWLIMLKDKLEERGEQKLFETIKDGYTRIRGDIII